MRLSTVWAGWLSEGTLGAGAVAQVSNGTSLRAAFLPYLLICSSALLHLSLEAQAPKHGLSYA